MKCALFLALAFSRLAYSASVPLSNGDFEATAPPCLAPCVPSGWTMVPGKNFHQVDSTQQHGGLSSLKLDPCGIGGTNSGTDGGLYQDSASIAGAICTYTFCLWAKGTGSSLDFSIEARSAANTKLAAFTYSAQSGSLITGTGGVWQQYCVSIAVASFPPATDHIRTYVFINPDVSCPAYFVDDLILDSSSCLSPSPTQTPSFSLTPTLSQTLTPSPTPTVTLSPSPPFTATITPIPTATPLPLLLSPITVNSPNPFGQGGTFIAYRLSVDAEIRISVYTVAGELVRNLDPYAGKSGPNETFYDGKNSTGADLASGIFIYKIRAKSPQNEYQEIWGKFGVLR